MNISVSVGLIIFLIIGTAIARPAMQRIMINNHVWEVPDEPGWEDVIREAATIQNAFDHCATASECREITKLLYAVFSNYDVSRKYLESNSDDADELISSIFKWG